MRARRLPLAAAAALSLFAGSALALPPILDRIPAGTPVVITLPNPTSFQRNLDALTTAIEAPIPMLSVEDLLAMAGVVEGVKTDKAVVVFLPTVDVPEGEEPPGIALIPIDDYAKLLGNFGATPGPAGGIDEFENPEGDTVFARNIGDGYAALTDNRAALEGFTPATGSLKTIKAGIGAAGEALADSSDFVIIVDMEPLREKAREAVAAGKRQMADQMAAMGQEAGAVDSPLAEWLTGLIVDEARMVVAGARTGPTGMSLDINSSFKEGAYLAKVFAEGGKAGAMLNNLPVQPYLLALALDTSSQGVKRFFTDALAKSKEGAAAGEESPSFLLNSLGKHDGQAAIVGASPALFGGGLLVNTVGFTRTASGDAVLAAEKASMTALDGKTIGGASYAATYKEKATKVNNVDADLWEVRITPDGSDPTVAQGMAFIFGPQGGPGGFIAKGDGGVYTTFAKNSLLLGAALDASKSGKNLATDAVLSSVAGALPKGRIAEAFIGTKAIFDMVGPFAAMMGLPADAFSTTDSIPPVGLSISGDGGAGRATIFLPAPVLKAGLSVAMAMQEQMGGFGGMEDEDMEDEEAPAGGGGTGQPKF